MRARQFSKPATVTIVEAVASAFCPAHSPRRERSQLACLAARPRRPVLHCLQRLLCCLLRMRGNIVARACNQDDTVSNRACRQNIPMDDYRPSVSSKCPHSYVRLMEQCLHKTPDSRPDFLGGKINVVTELERLIFEEYQRLAAAASSAQ